MTQRESKLSVMIVSAFFLVVTVRRQSGHEINLILFKSLLSDQNYKAQILLLIKKIGVKKEKKVN
jgi:hypothetical protein